MQTLVEGRMALDVFLFICGLMLGGSLGFLACACLAVAKVADEADEQRRRP